MEIAIIIIFQVFFFELVTFAIAKMSKFFVYRQHISNQSNDCSRKIEKNTHFLTYEARSEIV